MLDDTLPRTIPLPFLRKGDFGGVVRMQGHELEGIWQQFNCHFHWFFFQLNQADQEDHSWSYCIYLLVIILLIESTMISRLIVIFLLIIVIYCPCLSIVVVFAFAMFWNEVIFRSGTRDFNLCHGPKLFVGPQLSKLASPSDVLALDKYLREHSGFVHLVQIILHGFWQRRWDQIYIEGEEFDAGGFQNALCLRGKWTLDVGKDNNIVFVD